MLKWPMWDTCQDGIWIYSLHTLITTSHALLRTSPIIIWDLPMSGEFSQIPRKELYCLVVYSTNKCNSSAYSFASVFHSDIDSWVQARFPVRYLTLLCPIRYDRTCCFNDQCRSIPINAGSKFCYWSKMWLNNDWSALVSMPQFWCGIDRYWSALIIDTACPAMNRESGLNANFPHQITYTYSRFAPQNSA